MSKLKKLDSNYEIVYRIDVPNNIEFIGGRWDQFLQENNIENSSVEQFLGQSLFTFIQGDISKLYLDLIKYLRQDHSKQIVFPFRCDSPYEKRHMRMQVKSFADRTIEFRTQITRIQKYPSDKLVFLKSSGTRSPLIVCSQCHQIKLEDKWMELEEGLEDGLLVNDVYMRICSICEDCSVNFKTYFKTSTGC